MRPSKFLRNRLDTIPRDPSDLAELPPLLVRVSDGHSTQLCQMPLTAALFMLRNRLCTAVGDVATPPTIVLDDEDVDEMFGAITSSTSNVQKRNISE